MRVVGVRGRPRGGLNPRRVTGTVTGRPGAQRLAVTSGGTIPDRGPFGVFLAGAVLIVPDSAVNGFRPRKQIAARFPHERTRGAVTVPLALSVAGGTLDVCLNCPRSRRSATS